MKAVVDSAFPACLAAILPAGELAMSSVRSEGASSRRSDNRASTATEANSMDVPKRLKHVFDSTLDCVKLLDRDGRLVRINECAVEALEISEPSEALGTSYFDFWAGNDRTAALDAAASARASGSGRFYGTYYSRSGRISVWDEVITHLEQSDDTDEGFLVVSRDITLLRSSLSRQRATAELSMLALESNDFPMILQSIAERLSVELDCPLTKVLQFADSADSLTLVAGVGWAEGLVGIGRVGIDRESQAGYTLLKDGVVVVEDLRTEERFSGPPLLREHNVVSGMSTVILGTDGRPFGVLGVHSPTHRKFTSPDVDFLVGVANIIASRWRQEVSEKARQVMLREMAHRSGNLLQVVSSIFSKTTRDATDIQEAKSKFGQRLAAMARCNLLLSRGGWSMTRLKDVINEVIEPFGREAMVCGRDILLPADVCFDLSLICFELATNSAKYGAFGPGDGQVQIKWSLSYQDSKRSLNLEWKDTSTPRIVKTPIGTGFGTSMIRTLTEGKHTGQAIISERPNYVCRLTIPIAELRDIETTQ